MPIPHPEDTAEQWFGWTVAVPPGATHDVANPALARLAVFATLHIADNGGQQMGRLAPEKDLVRVCPGLRQFGEHRFP